MTEVKPKPDQFRILRPITPGVFAAGGSQDQIQITLACQAEGIELKHVTAVSMYRGEVLSVDVRHELTPMHEPQPDDPDCPDYTNGYLAHMAWAKCQEEHKPKFERWAEIQHLKAELARMDAYKPPRTYR